MSFLPNQCHSFRNTVIPSVILSFLPDCCHSFHISVIPSEFLSLLPNYSHFEEFCIIFSFNPILTGTRRNQPKHEYQVTTAEICNVIPVVLLSFFPNFCTNRIGFKIINTCDYQRFLLVQFEEKKVEQPNLLNWKKVTKRQCKYSITFILHIQIIKEDLLKLCIQNCQALY